MAPDPSKGHDRPKSEESLCDLNYNSCNCLWYFSNLGREPSLAGQVFHQPCDDPQVLGTVLGQEDSGHGQEHQLPSLGVSQFGADSRKRSGEKVAAK